MFQQQTTSSRLISNGWSSELKNMFNLTKSRTALVVTFPPPSHLDCF